MNIKHKIPHFVRNDKFWGVDHRRVFVPSTRDENPPAFKRLIVIPNGVNLPAGRRNEESLSY